MGKVREARQLQAKAGLGRPDGSAATLVGIMTPARVGRIELAELRKADGATIRIALDRYKGRFVLDVRLWYQPDGSTEFVPTRKGITLDADRLPEFAEAVAEALRRTRENG